MRIVKKVAVCVVGCSGGVTLPDTLAIYMS